MSVLSLVSSALLQRADKFRLTQFKPPQAPSCEYTDDWLIDKRHYQDYCQLVGWRDTVNLHPCYLQMLSLPLQIKCLTTPNSPFPVMGLVHRTNAITQQASIDMEQPVTLYARYGKVRQHSRGWEFEITVEGRQQKHSVYQATAGYLVKVRAPHVSPSPKRVKPAPLALPEAANELAVLDVPAHCGRAYARLSGDANPIHLSRASAALFGYKRPIAHGMWSLAQVLSAVQQDNASQNVCHFSSEGRFLRPVYLPGRMRVYQATDQHTAELWLVSDNADVGHYQGSLSIGS